MGNSAQCHVICLPLAGASHAVQREDWGHVSVMATCEVRDVKATDLYPVAREDCAVCCSHRSTFLIVCARHEGHAVSCHQSFTHSNSKNDSSAVGSGWGSPSGTVTVSRMT